MYFRTGFQLHNSTIDTLISSIWGAPLHLYLKVEKDMEYREYYDWCSCESLGYSNVITLHFNPKLCSSITYFIGGIADISKLLSKYSIDRIGNVILDNTESWMNSACITKNGVYRHCEVSLTGDFIITKTIDLK